MPLILAIEPDRRQAAQLTQIARHRVHADLVLADTTERALDVIGDRVPDLVLVPALLSPQDDAALAAALRVIAAASNVRTLTIPVFASAGGQTGKRGLLGRFRRRQPERATDGCDPAVFAEQISEYLRSVADERETWESDGRRGSDVAAAAARTERPIEAPELTATAVAEQFALSDDEFQRTTTGPVYAHPDYASDFDRLEQQARGGWASEPPASLHTESAIPDDAPAEIGVPAYSATAFEESIVAPLAVEEPAITASGTSEAESEPYVAPWERESAQVAAVPPEPTAEAHAGVLELGAVISERRSPQPPAFSHTDLNRPTEASLEELADLTVDAYSGMLALDGRGSGLGSPQPPAPSHHEDLVPADEPVAALDMGPVLDEIEIDLSDEALDDFESHVLHAGDNEPRTDNDIEADTTVFELSLEDAGAMFFDDPAPAPAAARPAARAEGGPVNEAPERGRHWDVAQYFSPANVAESFSPADVARAFSPDVAQDFSLDVVQDFGPAGEVATASPRVEPYMAASCGLERQWPPMHTAVGEFAKAVARIDAAAALEAPPAPPARPAAAPVHPAGVRSEHTEWTALVASLRQDIERLRNDQTGRAAITPPPARLRPVSQPAKPASAPSKKAARPPQDEWGFFDPAQCGFAALLAKLDEITEPGDDTEGRRAS
jgi:hypothetical protein